MFQNQNNNKKYYVFMKIRPLIGRHIRIDRPLYVNQPLRSERNNKATVVMSVTANDSVRISF